MSVFNIKSDKIGIIASGLCMIHCLATPLIFLAKSCSATCCSGSPTWWSAIDVVFLLISLVAVYQTVKHTGKKWVSITIGVSWILLLLVILNEHLQFVNLFDNAIYIPASALIVFHFYNMKYCSCPEDSCQLKEA